MSTERLIARLLRAGVDEEKIGEMDRAQMLDMWAEFVSTGRDKPTVVGESVVRPISAGFDSDLQRRMFEFEIMKFEQDKKEREERRRREDEEREERRRREEEERRLREEERQERRIREEAEREHRLRELKIREDELARRTRRDRDEAEKRQSLAARTKFFSEAMKNVFLEISK
jgi:membrane protein involved in colicin uptake